MSTTSPQPTEIISWPSPAAISDIPHRAESDEAVRFFRGLFFAILMSLAIYGVIAFALYHFL